MDFAIMVGGALSTRSESPEPFEDGGIEGGVIISFDQLSLNSDHDASPNRAISTRSESPEPIEAIRGGVIISVERPEPERPSSPLKSSSFLVSQNEEEETKVKEKASVSKGRQPQAKKATPPPKKKKVPVTTGKEPQAKEAKKEKAKPSVSRKTVVNDFNQYFGAVSKLKNWQALCKDLSIEPVPTSLTQCRKALRGVWVNIVDFLERKQTNQPQHFFPSQNALAKYTRKTKKFYPKKAAKKEGPLKELLAHISHRKAV